MIASEEKARNLSWILKDLWGHANPRHKADTPIRPGSCLVKSRDLLSASSAWPAILAKRQREQDAAMAKREGRKLWAKILKIRSAKAFSWLHIRVSSGSWAGFPVQIKLQFSRDSTILLTHLAEETPVSLRSCTAFLTRLSWGLPAPPVPAVNWPRNTCWRPAYTSLLPQLGAGLSWGNFSVPITKYKSCYLLLLFIILDQATEGWIITDSTMWKVSGLQGFQKQYHRLKALVCK